MTNHPIPQNVTAYEFHLIGNMTVKQFIELGVGIGIAVFFFSTGLPSFVKWPLVFFSLIAGAAMAFMPFDGRPLDRMIIIFFRAVYSPTQYIWRKQNPVPSYFNFTRSQTGQVNHAEIEKQRLRKNLSEYLDTLPRNQSSPSDLDTQETSYISSLNQMFDEVQPASQVTPSNEEIVVSPPNIRVRKMMPETAINTQEKALPEIPSTESIQIPENQPVVPVVSSTATPISNPQPTTVLPQPESNLMYRPTPTETPVAKAVTNVDLPFPAPPNTPNTLVGMVLDENNKIVENAIIEIRDKNQTPVKALKSNQLGQFFSASPLNKGLYEIEVQKPGLQFDIISLNLKNQIVPPLEIKAKSHG